MAGRCIAIKQYAIVNYGYDNMWLIENRLCKL